MLQHSRIRATYNIEGRALHDCCSSYYCPICTLMQDDREIRAREQQETRENRKHSNPINNQPGSRPDMQYAAPHRGSLEIRDTNTPEAQSQDCKTKGSNSEKQYDSSQSAHNYGHKKLHNIPKVPINGEKPDSKGKKVSRNDKSDGSHPGNTYDKNHPPVGSALSPATKYTKPVLEDRDAIPASRQTGRGQDQSMKEQGCPKHTLANCSGSGARGSENQGPVINRSTRVDYSEDASISQVRGKRVLKQLIKARSHTVRSADESVLVFYNDADQPQRHRLADCARLRASTLGRSGTPHHNGLPARWRRDETVGDNDQSETAKTNGLSGAPEADTTDLPKHATLQHTLDDCPVNNSINAVDGKKHRCGQHTLEDCPHDNTHIVVGAKKQRSLSHSLVNCTSDSTNNTADAKQHINLPHSLGDCTGGGVTTTNEVDDPSSSIVQPTQQHVLDDCAVDITTTAASPISSREVTQHNLAECLQTITDSKTVGSTTFDQHEFSDCPISTDAQPLEASNLEQHEFTDCTIITGAQCSEMSDAHLGFDPRDEQNESHTVTITVPEPSVAIVTIVTSTDALEDVSEEQHDVRRSKSSETVVVSGDSKIPAGQEVLYEKGNSRAGPPERCSDHDGASDADAEYEDPLKYAAAALRKVLDAATTERCSKTPEYGRVFLSNEPFDVNTDATATNKSAAKARRKATSGRGQWSKEKA